RNSNAIKPDTRLGSKPHKLRPRISNKSWLLQHGAPGTIDSSLRDVGSQRRPEHLSHRTPSTMWTPSSSSRGDPLPERQPLRILSVSAATRRAREDSNLRPPD